jgi:hypothetical protein
MPWAAWVIAALLAAVWVPVAGEWVANAIIILTLSSIALLLASFQERSGPVAGAIMTVSINQVAPDQSALSLLAGFLGELGWPGAIWLAIVVVLGVWIARRVRARRSVRGLVNALILVAGWPICFWTAIAAEHVLARSQ